MSESEKETYVSESSLEHYFGVYKEAFDYYHGSHEKVSYAHDFALKVMDLDANRKVNNTIERILPNMNGTMNQIAGRIR